MGTSGLKPLDVGLFPIDVIAEFHGYNLTAICQWPPCMSRVNFALLAKRMIDGLQSTFFLLKHKLLSVCSDLG